jgi:hypothetical protein
MPVLLLGLGYFLQYSVVVQLYLFFEAWRTTSVLLPLFQWLHQEFQNEDDL